MWRNWQTRSVEGAVVGGSNPLIRILAGVMQPGRHPALKMPVLRVRISPPAFLCVGPLLSRSGGTPRGKANSTFATNHNSPARSQEVKASVCKTDHRGFDSHRAVLCGLVSVAQWAYNPHRSGSILRAATYAGVMQPGRHLWLKPGVLRVRFSPPALIVEMGMNAKRSRDRFFKPVLASSSLAIPARLWRSNPKWCGAGLLEPVLESSTLSDRPCVPRSSNWQDAGL